MALDWSSLIGSVAGGGLLGLAGNALSLGLNIWKAKVEHRQQVELLTLQSEAKTAEAASAIAVAREQGAAAAFTASIQADGTISGEHRWAKTFRAVTRPGLTWTGLLVAAICALAGIDNPATQLLDAYTGMMLAWWFGQRAIDRSTLTWGSKIATGRVAASPTK